MAIGRPRAFDVDTVLDKATRVFWQHGYDGTTLGQLTEAMGIGVASLYAAFGNKVGLFKSVLDRYTAVRTALIDEIVDAQSVREVAERMLTYAANAHTDPSHPPGCLLIQGGLACGVGAESIPIELAARRARTKERLRDRFVKAQADGELSPNADPAALADYLLAATIGMGVMAPAVGREVLHQVARISLKAFCYQLDGE
jgi:AcrR family transcriptional regulator